MPNPTLPDIKEELSLDVLVIDTLITNKKPLVRDDLIELRDSLLSSMHAVQKIQDMLTH